MDILLAIFPRYLPSILPGMPGTITLRHHISLQFPYHYYQEVLYNCILFFIIGRHYITKCAFCNNSEHIRFFNNIALHIYDIIVSHNVNIRVTCVTRVNRVIFSCHDYDELFRNNVTIYHDYLFYHIKNPSCNISQKQLLSTSVRISIPCLHIMLQLPGIK